MLRYAGTVFVHVCLHPHLAKRQLSDTVVFLFSLRSDYTSFITEVNCFFLTKLPTLCHPIIAENGLFGEQKIVKDNSLTIGQLLYRSIILKILL